MLTPLVVSKIHVGYKFNCECILVSWWCWCQVFISRRLCS